MSFCDFSTFKEKKLQKKCSRAEKTKIGLGEF